MKTDVKILPEVLDKPEVVSPEDLVPADSSHLGIAHGRVTLHGQADTWGRCEDEERALRHRCLTSLTGGE
jgi:hypothetical protein